MRGTRIQWPDDTVNPVAGCDDCELFLPARPDESTCYSEEQTRRRAGHSDYPKSFSDVMLFPGRMGAAAGWPDLSGRRRLLFPWRNGLPRMVFVSDMGDALSSAVSFDYLATEIVEVVLSPAGQRHIWQWLTKRARRMAAFSAWLLARGVACPVHLWAGTSITACDNVGRVLDLGEVGEAQTVRFLSLEPQRERINPELLAGKVSWLIQGGESSKRANPFELAWAGEVRDACARFDIAYFLKQLGRPPYVDGVALPLKDRHGGDWDEWPADLRTRCYPALLTAPFAAPALKSDPSSGDKNREANFGLSELSDRSRRAPQGAV